MTAVDASRLGTPSHLVRFVLPGGVSYDRMIVVTERDDGETLFLAGWIGKPLSRHDWHAARDALFPRARRVIFERVNRETGRVRLATLELRPRG